jgi:hypothetical protein
MTIEIIERQFHAKGVIYSIKASDKILKILYLSHAIERIKKWGITEKTVAEALILPEEVTVEHRNRYIAHRRYGNHLVRAVYEYEGRMPVLVTVYFPYAERYFKGGGIYEDKILG